MLVEIDRERERERQQKDFLSRLTCLLIMVLAVSIAATDAKDKLLWHVRGLHMHGFGAKSSGKVFVL